MSIRSKAFVVTLVAVAGIAVAGYAAAPWLLAKIAIRGLDGVVDIHELDVQSVSLSRVEVASVRAGTAQLQLEASGATIRFEPWPFRVLGIDVRRARLAVAGTSAGPGQTTVPALPDFPLQIDELALAWQTPWGELATTASVASAPGGAGGLSAEIHGPEFSALLTNPERGRHNLDLLDAGATRLLTVNASTDAQDPLAFDTSLNAGALSTWLRHTSLAPPELKSLLEPYALSGDSVSVRGELEWNLDFTAELHGRVGLRDRRGPARRLFESLALDPESGYRLRRSGRQWSGDGEARVSFLLDPETTFTGRNPAWTWNGEALDLELVSAELAPLGLRADSARANAVMTGTDGFSGEIRAGGLRIEPWPGDLGHYDIDGTWSWGDDALEAAGSGDGSGLPRLDWKLAAAGASGSVDVRIDDSVAAIQSSLAPYAATVAPDLEVLAGRLQGRYHTRWDRDRVSTTLGVQAGAVDADLGGMEIRGLDVEVNNLDNGVERFSAVISAPTLKLAAGTVAEDLDMALRWQPPALHVDRAGTRLFDGRITVRPFHFNIDDESIAIQADVDGLSLERVMALMELETTELTGQVAGPVRIVYHRDRGIEINRGELRSVASGILKFRMGGEPEVNAQADNIALQALADFRYDELSASVLYTPDGQYRITARILGRNPEVLDGHPIAFNPTIEGRLPALFRAFFFTGDFNQAIIQRLQQERGASTPGGASTLQEQ